MSLTVTPSFSAIDLNLAALSGESLKSRIPCWVKFNSEMNVAIINLLSILLALLLYSGPAQLRSSFLEGPYVAVEGLHALRRSRKIKVDLGLHYVTIDDVPGRKRLIHRLLFDAQVGGNSR